MKPIVFVTLEETLAAHAAQIAVFGGADGLRDLALLESALAQPQASFGGEYLHTDLHAMAAAYLFHLVSNHPFVDGNKRTGFVVAISFLRLNAISIDVPLPELYDLTLAVAAGQLSKEQLAIDLRRIFPLDAGE